MPLVLSEELARRTTKQLARNLESVGLLVQSMLIANTVLVDKLRPPGATVLLSLVLLHVIWAIAGYQFGGLLPLGGKGVSLYILGILTVPWIMALLTRPGEYGSTRACVQLCGYPIPPIFFFSFYPWLSFDRDYLRPALHLVVLSAVVVEPLLIIYCRNGYVTDDNFVSVGIYGSLILATYVFGRMFGAVCRAAAQAQLDVLEAEYQRLFGYLHSTVETGLAVIHRQFRMSALGQPPESFRELEQTVNRERARLLLVHPDVSMAQLLNLHVRRVSGAIVIAKVPHTGGLTLSRSTALLMDRTLGDLLKNSIVHEATTVSLHLDVEHSHFSFTVVDDGPGFRPAVLEDQSNSLSRLRDDIRAAGGDLVKEPADAGASMRVSLPFESIAKVQRNVRRASAAD
ncbi:hypothetical protein BCD48_39745 [Pseudofrankia sp. BMG5.36]|nr:hypothetical protein BCD48_39745 [Pseudofrankia sp. BMG5.36]